MLIKRRRPQTSGGIHLENRAERSFVLNSESRHAKGLILWIPPVWGPHTSTVYDLSHYKEHGVGSGWNPATQPMYVTYDPTNVTPHVPFIGFDGLTAGDTVINWSSPSVRLRDLPLTYNFSVASWLSPESRTLTNSLWAWSGTDDIVYYPNDSSVSGSRLFWRDLGGSILVDANADPTGGDPVWDVFVSRASDNHELYRNGKSIDTDVATGSAGPFTAFHYGAWVSGSQQFAGWYGDLRVYARALTSDEVLDMYEDPWDLYYEIGTKSYVFFGAAGITIEQEGFRFRNDDGSEAAATWRQAQDVDDSAAKDLCIRLRTLVNATGDPASSQYQLEQRLVGGSAWTKIDVE